MNREEMFRLGTEVARHLSLIRKEAWAVESSTPHDQHHSPWVVIGQPDTRARLRLSLGGRGHDGQVAVDGVFPDGTSHRSYTAYVTASRGALVVARDGNLRVLRRGYLDELPGVLERKAEADRTEAEREMLLSRVAELFGEPGPERGRVFLQRWLQGTGYAEVYRTGIAPALTLSLSGVPVPVALRMLAVLAASVEPEREGACCLRYGWRHKREFSVAGCAQLEEGPPPLLPAELEAAYDAYVFSGDWARMSWGDWIKSRAA
jgi:hypothetical protein